ncbi:hypothetical protein AJ80_08893 [Polytolypa hystricis UAMH7299]|uniref:Uncharacterized protein n=1 Tax=Polytolypa hystricis (strain UAMH7299) TaxID=1447883 RepID=A0A2B7X0S1_POLH7|nr:hypothetical protein AJ80_08893 [Polytolypa hystricis UAMH7299]
MEPGLDLSVEDENIDSPTTKNLKEHYQSARSNNKPTEQCWKAFLWVLRYLKGSMEMGITYTKGSHTNLVSYSDADWAGKDPAQKSTSGYNIGLAGGLVAWQSSRQDCTAKSSTEVEYIEAAYAGCELIWLGNLIEDCKLSPSQNETTENAAGEDQPGSLWLRTEMEETRTDSASTAGSVHGKCGIHSLPNELLYKIADSTNSETTINHLCQASQHLYEVLNPYLYWHNAIRRGKGRRGGRSAMQWAAEHGMATTARHALDVPTCFPSPKPLHVAATRGHVDIVKLLLHTPYEQLEWRDKSGHTALAVAALNGHAEIVRLLINAGSHPNPAYRLHGVRPNPVEPGNKDTYLIMLAAAKGHVEVVKLLLDSGKVDVNMQGRGNETLLMIAARILHVGLVQLLIERGANPNCRSWAGEALLLSLVRAGRADIVKMLLSVPGIDTNVLDHTGNGPLIIAAKWGHVDVAKLLMTTAGIDLNKTSRDGYTALSLALQGADLDMVRQLLSAERTDVNLGSPLCEAAKRDNVDIIKPIVATGRVNQSMLDEALATAVRHRKEPLIKALLDAGADPCGRIGPRGYTPLMLSCFSRGSTDTKILLDSGRGNLETRCDKGCSVLYYAVTYGRPDIVQLLLGSKRIDCNGGCLNGNCSELPDCGNPLLAATMAGYVEIVKLLLSQENIDLNVTDAKGRPALCIAASHKQNLEVTKLLLAYKATDPNLRDSNGLSALDHAMKYGTMEAVELLLSVEGIDATAREVDGTTPLEFVARLEKCEKDLVPLGL